MTREEAIDVLKHNYPSGCFTDLCEAVEIAIKALSAQPDPHYDEWCTDCKEYDKDKHCCPRWNRVIRQTLNDVQTEPQWIPCSERLPEEYGEYRITWITSASRKRFIGDSEFEVTSVWDNEHDRFKGEWLLDDYIKNYPNVKVLAWKPLEEPWRGEK